MRKYETMLLLSPELAGEARETMLAALVGVIEREGGKLVIADHWGMRDIAYPIKKQTRGYYVRLEYLAPGKLVAELERNIRITEGIFRFVTIQLEETAEEAANV
jgi:small subunit ribosomal protein S6